MGNFLNGRAGARLNALCCDGRSASLNPIQLEKLAGARHA